MNHVSDIEFPQFKMWNKLIPNASSTHPHYSSLKAELVEFGNTVNRTTITATFHTLQGWHVMTCYHKYDMITTQHS